jgi:predicted secreted protein
MFNLHLTGRTTLFVASLMVACSVPVSASASGRASQRIYSSNYQQYDPNCDTNNGYTNYYNYNDNYNDNYYNPYPTYVQPTYRTTRTYRQPVTYTSSYSNTNRQPRYVPDRMYPPSSNYGNVIYYNQPSANYNYHYDNNYSYQYNNSYTTRRSSNTTRYTNDYNNSYNSSYDSYQRQSLPSNNGDNVNKDVNVGDTFTISLPGTSTGNYRWNASYDSYSLSLQSHSYSGSWEQFRFQALRRGTYSIGFEYGNNNSYALENVSYTIYVR